jgi:hypothetical protein
LHQETTISWDETNPAIPTDTEQEGPLPNQAIGDPLCIPKNHDRTRLYFQNVNGMNVACGGTWEITCRQLRTMEVDIVLLGEHKLNTNKDEVIKKMYEGARQVYGMG